MYVCGWLFITHSPPTYLQTHLNWIGQKLDLNPRGQIKAWPGDTKTSQNYFLNNSNNFQLARCIKFCPLNTKFSSQESNSTDIKIINGMPLLSTLESLIICCFTSCHHLLPLCTKIIIQMGKFCFSLHPRILTYIHFENNWIVLYGIASCDSPLCSDIGPPGIAVMLLLLHISLAYK